MGSAYRTRAIARPTRRATALGTGERVVIQSPLSPDEVVERLKRGTAASFEGEVSAYAILLVPTAKTERALRVRGRVVADGSGSRVELQIGLAPKFFALAAATPPAFAAAGIAIYLAPAIWMAALKAAATTAGAAGALVTGVRVGIGSVRRKLLEALGENDVPR